MKSTTLVFPHQLFEHHPALSKKRAVWLVEETLFFRQYTFHKQKLAFHRASMKYYESMLSRQGFKVHYTGTRNELSDVRNLLPYLSEQGFTEIHFTDPVDDWLTKRISNTAREQGLKTIISETPMFLNSSQEIDNYFKNRKRYFQTDFYKHERKKRGILTEQGNKPLGGKWSYDSENRKKYPAGKLPPVLTMPTADAAYREAVSYTLKHFPSNYGELDNNQQYPVTHEQARTWLDDFITFRLEEFGPFEDAIVRDANVLHHSVLTPMLNTGLLTPLEVIEKVLARSGGGNIPLQSLEGFIRQVMGWREFIRGIYRMKGVQERTRNFWRFSRRIPDSFWEGTTGITPLDHTIKKVLDTGYAHHIERLMILGNFMLLCEFDPDEVYRWFMELFIDAYDWVMVPNVYGMSQFADGGLFATKPYISSSNYILKMSDYKKGPWQEPWDALFWRFMNTYRDIFMKNPRLAMLVRTFDRWPGDKQQELISKADHFLNGLDKK